MIGAETADDVYGPLRKVVELRGRILLMGVGLDRMTMLHLAELEAGRRPFVHWARGVDGPPVRVLGGKCSRGFEKLGSTVAPFEVRTKVPSSPSRLFDVCGTVAAGRRHSADASDHAFWTRLPRV